MEKKDSTRTDTQRKNINRATWLEINLDAIHHNIQQIRDYVDPEVQLLGIVKCDAYGHGALEIARCLEAGGCVSALGVAIIDEAIELRKGGIRLPILVLGYTQAKNATELAEFDIQQTVFSLSYAKQLSKAASEIDRKIKIQIKIETGMGRLGFFPDSELYNSIKKIIDLNTFEISGIYTHFSVADSNDREYTDIQFNKFKEILIHLRSKGLTFKNVHCSNSPALILYPEYNLDMVRVGIITYGLWPSSNINSNAIKLVPALQWKTQIVHLKYLNKDEFISYGCNYQTSKRERIATLPVGFGDGLNRLLSSKMNVLVRGEQAPQVGNICMDQCMINVTNVPGVEVGDEVVIIGEQSGKIISAEEVAQLRQSHSYEVITNISKRVPRIYTSSTSFY